MYDDLSSLTAKLKMSGVSFQKINDEDGATMQTAVTVTTPDVNGDVKETIVETVPADIHLESSQPAPNVNTLSWPKAKPALVQNAFSSPTGGILESVAACPARRPNRKFANATRYVWTCYLPSLADSPAQLPGWRPVFLISVS
jgi:hypothetical protein